MIKATTSLQVHPLKLQTIHVYGGGGGMQALITMYADFMCYLNTV